MPGYAQDSDDFWLPQENTKKLYVLDLSMLSQKYYTSFVLNFLFSTHTLKIRKEHCLSQRAVTATELLDLHCKAPSNPTTLHQTTQMHRREEQGCN